MSSYEKGEGRLRHGQGEEPGVCLQAQECLDPQQQKKQKAPSLRACGSVKPDLWPPDGGGMSFCILNHHVYGIWCSSPRKGIPVSIIFNSHYGYGDWLLLNQVTERYGIGHERGWEESREKVDSGGGEKSLPSSLVQPEGWLEPKSLVPKACPPR